jgi:hypothetical protein
VLYNLNCVFHTRLFIFSSQPLRIVVVRKVSIVHIRKLKTWEAEKCVLGSENASRGPQAQKLLPPDLVYDWKLPKNSNIFLKFSCSALASVAQLVGHHSIHWNVSNPGQGTPVEPRLLVQSLVEVYAGGNWSIDVSLSHQYFSFSPSL